MSANAVLAPRARGLALAVALRGTAPGAAAFTFGATAAALRERLREHAHG